jgi:hypothetical protein
MTFPENYSRKDNWLEAAARHGYQVEEENGNLIAHRDGVEFGRWDSRYGGFGWFEP